MTQEDYAKSWWKLSVKMHVTNFEEIIYRYTSRQSLWLLERGIGHRIKGEMFIAQTQQMQKEHLSKCNFMQNLKSKPTKAFYVKAVSFDVLIQA